MLRIAENSDPRWPPEIHEAIESKVAQAMGFQPRLSLSADGKTPASEEQRRNLLTITFREIVKATSIDTLMTAPPALLEQLSVLALVNNENVKGILVQVIRVFMLLWGTPETNDLARKFLVDMEEAAKVKLFVDAGQPILAERLKWAPMP